MHPQPTIPRVEMNQLSAEAQLSDAISSPLIRAQELVRSLNSKIPENAAKRASFVEGHPRKKYEHHGHATAGYSAEYRVWSSMKQRCAPMTGQARYAGRGITVCAQWRESFLQFLKDLGPRPSPKHSLDRINNDGNYEPGNCRWATTVQQAENKGNNHRITIRGQTKPICEWARIAGLDYSVLAYRAANKWPEENLLLPLGSISASKPAKLFMFNGKMVGGRDIDRALGFPIGTVKRRDSAGWPEWALTQPRGFVYLNRCGTVCKKAAKIIASEKGGK